MEFKTFRNAIEYSPNKVQEFIASYYSILDSEAKAIFKAMFQRYFLDDGTPPLDEED